MVRKTKYDFYDDWFKATAVELGALPGVQAQGVGGYVIVRRHCQVTAEHSE